MKMTCKEGQILFEQQDNGVASIVFDVPERCNAMSMTVYERACDLVWQSEQHEVVKVIAFRGNGKAFCSGQDVEDAYRALRARDAAGGGQQWGPSAGPLPSA